MKSSSQRVLGHPSSNAITSDETTGHRWVIAIEKGFVFWLALVMFDNNLIGRNVGLLDPKLRNLRPDSRKILQHLNKSSAETFVKALTGCTTSAYSWLKLSSRLNRTF